MSPAWESAGGTVVVAERSDPYYGLAEWIVSEEGIGLAEDVGRALEGDPLFILLVASPDRLTEQRLLGISRAFRERDVFPGLGIITGGTLDLAEALWKRGKTRPAGPAFLGGDSEQGQSVAEPSIISLDGESPERLALTKESLIDNLARSGFFYWTRHVAEKSWFWNTESESFGEGDRLRAADLPEMDSAMIFTPSCGSFQPWVSDSIALAFTDRGAAAYLGNMRSPFSNAFLMRRGASVPGPLTWKEFPLGIAGQIVNRATAKAVLDEPLFFMLGDPRLYVSEDRPYRIDSDTADGGSRAIRGRSEESGVLAMKVDGGAGYDFLAVKGVSAASADDLFYNYRLQFMDLGADKYVLFFHQGGSFELELRRQAPPLWRMADAVIDALDFSWVAIGNVNGPFAFLPLMLFLAVLLWKTLRRRRPVGRYAGIFLFSLLLAGLRAGYVLLRMDEYSIAATVADWSAADIGLGFLGVFASTAGGLMVMRDARRFPVLAAGLILAVLPEFFLTAFYFGVITVTNLAYKLNPSTGYWVWNYTSFWLTFAVLVAEDTMVVLVHRLSRRSGEEK